MRHPRPESTQVSSPVWVSRTPIHTVTKVFVSFVSPTCAFTAVRISAGVPPTMARSPIMIFTAIMNNAAGTPLPDTSAMTSAR